MFLYIIIIFLKQISIKKIKTSYFFMFLSVLQKPILRVKGKQINQKCSNNQNTSHATVFSINFLCNFFNKGIFLINSNDHFILQ